MDFAFNLLIIIIDQILLFAINIMVARNTGEVLYGNFSVATQGLLILGTLLTLGIDSIIDYYIPKLHHLKHYKKIVSLIASIKRFMIPIYISVFITGLSVFFIFIFDISPKLNHEVLVHPFYIFIWGAVFIACYNILIHLLRSINQMRIAVNMSLLQNVLYLLLVGLFISLGNHYLVHPTIHVYYPHLLLIAFVGSYGITGFVCYALLGGINHGKKKLPPEGVPIKWRGKIQGYTIQNLNGYVFAAIPLLVLEFISPSEHNTGLFAAVISIITVAHLAIYPLGILVAPDISSALSHSSRQLKKILSRYLKVCFAISLGVIVIVGIFAQPILYLFKSDFIDALPYLYVSLFEIVIYGISLPLTKMVMFSANGSHLGAKLTLCLLATQTVASFVLIKQFDIVGAVICFIGISLINMLALLSLSRAILTTPKDARQFLADIYT
ncbi:hypothetical protein [Legionella sp. W05-934-2]|jgi:O-antigen/teichoic acid export membrane protein|uniref:hypothetical protein n=1 Tax=Legionella sp. W05-934-2 TaxID=1198649 RepID=UPI003462FCBD